MSTKTKELTHQFNVELKRLGNKALVGKDLDTVGEDVATFSRELWELSLRVTKEANPMMAERLPNTHVVVARGLYFTALQEFADMCMKTHNRTHGQVLRLLSVNNEHADNKN